MAINLEKGIPLTKGQTIDLRKNAKGESVYDLSQVTVGLGWDVREEKKYIKQIKEQSIIDKLLNRPIQYEEVEVDQDDFDLDAIAFILDSNGFVANLGNTNLHGGDIIFFNSMTYPSGSGTSQSLYPQGTPKSTMEQKVKKLLNSGELIVHTGDNLTGEGDGDDEQIIVKLDALPSKIDKILFLVCIYKGLEKDQHFGQVDNAFIRACDAKGTEIARYSLSNSPEFNGMRSMIFGEMYRHNSEWKFRALGNPETTDNFVQILKRYVKQ